VDRFWDGSLREKVKNEKYLEIRRRMGQNLESWAFLDDRLEQEQRT
jgi:hypothetical protein